MLKVMVLIMEIVEPFNLFWTLIISFILSFYYIFFLVIPLRFKEKNYGYDLFIVRLFIIVVLIFFSPTLVVILDFLFLFILSFTIVPKIKRDCNKKSIDKLNKKKYNKDRM